MSLGTWHGSELVFSEEFDFVFLYKGCIFGLNAGHDLYRTSLEQAVRSVSEVNGIDPKILDAYTTDNRGLNRTALEGYVPPLPEAADLALHVDPKNVVWERVASLGANLGSGEVLDMNVYFDRVYISTTSGLWHVDIDVSSSYEFHHEKPVKRTDAYSLSSTAKYGCVLVSCGDDGLMAGFDDFNSVGRARTELQQIGARSQRVAWLRSDVINYEWGSEANFLTAEKQSKVDSKPDEMEFITELRPTSSVSTLYGQESRLAFNTETDLISVGVDGLLTYTDRLYNKRERSLGQVMSEYSANVGFPLHAHRLAGSVGDFSSYAIILQTLEGVFEIRKTGVLKIHDGVAVSIKTFPASLRYQNMIAICSDTAVRIMTPTPSGLASL